MIINNMLCLNFFFNLCMYSIMILIDLLCLKRGKKNYVIICYIIYVFFKCIVIEDLNLYFIDICYV